MHHYGDVESCVLRPVASSPRSSPETEPRCCQWFADASTSRMSKQRDASSLAVSQQWTFRLGALVGKVAASEMAEDSIEVRCEARILVMRLGQDALSPARPSTCCSQSEFLSTRSLTLPMTPCVQCSPSSSSPLFIRVSTARYGSARTSGVG